MPEFSKTIFIYVMLGFANATPPLFHDQMYHLTWKNIYVSLKFCNKVFNGRYVIHKGTVCPLSLFSVHRINGGVCVLNFLLTNLLIVNFIC